MKFSLSIFSICVALLLCSVAQAQQIATADDGRKVLLNADGTWKYAEVPGVLLTIEAKLIYKHPEGKPGGVNMSVSRTPFLLLDTDPVKELKKFSSADVDGMFRKICNEPLSEITIMLDVVLPYARYVLTTDYNGKAQLSNIKPGKYWLYGYKSTGTGDCALWLMEVDLTKNQSLTLNQFNAISVK